MLDLRDPKWKEFEGGYRIPYDASVALLDLERTNDTQKIEEIFIELWDELHHQGDVGLASYYSIPHLVRIGIKKNLIDYNLFGLVAVIEIQRHAANPPLPKDLELSYSKALTDLGTLVSKAIDADWDLPMSSSVLAVLATSKGQIKLAKAILNLDSGDIIDEFLENY